MFQLLALLAGAIISIMVSVNGGLTGCFGALAASVIIHVVGVVFALLLCLIQKKRPFQRAAVPLWACCGGIIGVLTTLFNNYAYAHLSMTSIVALGLFGQCVTSNLLDAWGLLGMTRRPVRRSTRLGIVLSCAGVLMMLDRTLAGGLCAVLLSLGAGVTVVLSRTVNARLSAAVSALAGFFTNHLVGLPVCMLLAALIPASGGMAPHTLKPWMLSGGMLGVLVVLLFNVTVQKLPAFRLTLLSFLGQIFTGITMDLACGRDIPSRLFWGSIVCAVGLLTGMLLERRDEQATNP